MKAINLFLVLMLSYSTFKANAANEGGSSGGGGDASEARIDEIRADLKMWMKTEGPAGLRLPFNISHDKYVTSMTAILAPKYVTVSFVTLDEEERTQDPELKVTISGKKKTCRGFISERDRKPNILCSVERFKNITDDEQYRLVHHEYAGLAGIEKNEEAASDYTISNQITDYIEKKEISRLSVKRSSDIKYFIIDKRMDNHVAQEQCEKKGARLATVRELAMLSYKFGSRGIRETAYSNWDLNHPKVIEEIEKMKADGFEVIFKTYKAQGDHRKDVIDFYYSRIGYEGELILGTNPLWTSNYTPGTTKSFYALHYNGDLSARNTHTNIFMDNLCVFLTPCSWAKPICITK